jgi:hypothetical protein
MKIRHVKMVFHGILGVGLKKQVHLVKDALVEKLFDDLRISLWIQL